MRPGASALARSGFAAMLAGACVFPEEGAERPLPESGFLFYTGEGGRAGDLYSGISEWTHEESNKTCVVIPMLHIADAGFYRAVGDELERADVVLAEGVRGAPSLPSPLWGVTEYLFSNYSRLAAHAGATLQSEALVTGPNAQNADVTWTRWQWNMPWWTPLSQTVLTPLMAAFYEPLNAIAWLDGTLFRAAFAGDAFHAGFRHVLAGILDDEDAGSADALLPGVIDYRNEHLLSVLQRVVRRDDVNRIAIPWGAAHMPSLCEELERRGWRRGDTRWVRVLAVRSRARGEEANASDFMIPYAVHWRCLPPAWSLDLAFRTISVEVRPGGAGRFELLWDLLFTSAWDPESDARLVRVFPTLFGLPVLFQYARVGARSRVGFLLFFGFDL